MGRKPRISRDALLDAAETIVTRDGPTALTIEALAQALSISKGGVQYSFATKDALVSALIERSLQHFDASFTPEMAGTALDMVLAYLQAVRAARSASNAKLSALMIAYLQNPDHQRLSRSWYQRAFARLAGTTAEDRRARGAFLAIEGLYSMEMLGVLETDQALEILTEIEAGLLAAD